MRLPHATYFSWTEIEPGIVLYDSFRASHLELRSGFMPILSKVVKEKIEKYLLKTTVIILAHWMEQNTSPPLFSSSFVHFSMTSFLTVCECKCVCVCVPCACFKKRAFRKGNMPPDEANHSATIPACCTDCSVRYFLECRLWTCIKFANLFYCSVECVVQYRILVVCHMLC